MVPRPGLKLKPKPKLARLLSLFILENMSSHGYTGAQTIRRREDTTTPTPAATITKTGRVPGTKSISGATALGTFTGGDVWADPILSAKETFIALVTFTPCARTHWHRHEHGQLLRVTGGAGWYCDQGGQPRRISVGDVIWCPPGVVHWHGADDDSYMVHEATSFGRIEWYEPVGDGEYAAKKLE